MNKRNRLLELIRDSDRLDRFIRKINILNDDDCWQWKGYLDRQGYGFFSMKSVEFRAHRIAWVSFNGQNIPEGFIICHSCDNPSCINPNHLWMGTVADNTRDKVNKNRQPTGELIYNSKLTTKQVVEIRKRFATGGITQRKLAKEYGVVFQHISRIVRGERWQHLEDKS